MLVSVIIPCYNVQQYIIECIDSVLAQTHTNVEIICIDNNSTDSTWELLSQLKAKYSNIVIDKELKTGANAARNKGLALAKGDWIQFLDADDLLEPTKIKHQLKMIDSSDKNLSFIAASSKKRNLKGEDVIVSNLESNHFVAAFICKCGNTCSNLWNRKKLNEIGNWDENIKSSQETELMFKIVLNAGTYLIDKEPLTIVRERADGQISQGDPAKKWKQFIDIRLNYMDRLKALNKSAYDSNQNIFFDFLMVSLITLSKYNKAEAITIYNTHIKNNWKSSGNYGFSKFKVALIKTFGLSSFLYLSKN